MGSRADILLTNIHSGNSLEKNKDNPKKSNTHKLTKKELDLQADDNAMSEDEYNAAKAFYDIACPILKIDQTKHPFNQRNSIEDITSDDSKALDEIKEALGKDLPTETDFKNKQSATMVLNKKIVFACEIYDYLNKELNTTGIVSMLRSLNHISRINNKKSDNLEYNDISIGPNQKNFKNLMKCFEEACYDFIKQPLADDVESGAKKGLVNAFINLINSTFTFKANDCIGIVDDKGELVDVKDITVKIQTFKIMPDSEDKEIEDTASKVTKQLGIGGTIGSMIGGALKKLAQTAFNKVVMHESTEPTSSNKLNVLQVYEAYKSDNMDDDLDNLGVKNLEIDYTNADSILNAQNILKPIVNNLQLNAETDHQKQMDYRDYNTMLNVKNFLTDPNDVKRLLDYKSFNGWNINDIFSTLSRRMFIQSGFKNNLSKWDEKLGNKFSEQVPAFYSFSNRENAERNEDEKDATELSNNLSELSSALEIMKNMADTMPDFKEIKDKEEWIDENKSLIPFMTAKQLVGTKYAAPMGLRDKTLGDEIAKEQKSLETQEKAETDSEQAEQNKQTYQNMKSVKNKVSVRNVGNVTIPAPNSPVQQNESISSVAKQLQEYLR